MPGPPSLGVDRESLGPRPGSLGKRVTAAFIDMIPLAFAAVALAERTSDPDQQSISLQNERLGLWLLVVIGFWIVIESAGNSVGKSMAGLRVIDAGSGAAPAFPQTVKRSVARVVDGFPVFYLVGFLAAVSDPRRRRLGDRWAGTAVVPATDTSPGAAILSPLLLSIALIAGSVMIIAADPGPQLGAFDYDEEVAPFARSIADAMVDGDFERVEAALVEPVDGQASVSVRPLFEQAFDLMEGARFVEREERWEYSLAQRRDGTTQDTVIVYFELDEVMTENRLAVIVADVDGELVLFNVFVEFGP